MPSTVGQDLKNLPRRYAIHYTSSTKTWRILDLRHPEMVKVSDMETDDIPDDHPAVTILTEYMFFELIDKAVQLEILNPSVNGGILGNQVGNKTNVDSEHVELLKETIRVQEEEIKKLKADQGSESFRLKQLITNNLFKMAMGESYDAIGRLPG